MEEKKNTKISLVIFFLILAIILMSIFIFKLYDERTELTEKSKQQSEKIANLQNNIDNLTSETNKIAPSSISTENTTNNVSSATTTEEQHANIQPDLSSYIGLWKNSTNEYLYVYSINNNEIVFDLSDVNEKIKATLNGNIASFVINEGNNSLNGKMTLENNHIILNIIDSTFDNIAKGTITFSDYLGLQN